MDCRFFCKLVNKKWKQKTYVESTSLVSKYETKVKSCKIKHITKTWYIYTIYSRGREIELSTVHVTGCLTQFVTEFRPFRARVCRLFQAACAILDADRERERTRSEWNGSRKRTKGWILNRREGGDGEWQKAEGDDARYTSRLQPARPTVEACN